MPRLSDIPEIRDKSYEFQGEYYTLKHQEVCSHFHFQWILLYCKLLSQSEYS